MNLPTLPLVLAFGALGTGLRYGADQWAHQWISRTTSGAGFPWTTLAINLLGCFALGLLAGSESLRDPGLASLRTGLTVGLCGGFTTFSAYSLQSLELLQRSAWGAFFLYVLGSVALGIAAVALGFAFTNGLGAARA